MKEFDLFVIGGGSGGVRAARLAAGAGKRVAIAERAAFGGTCVNVGCIPKKLFSYASHLRESFGYGEGYGFVGGEVSRFDMARFISAKDAEILRLNGIYESLLRDSGVEIFRGDARFEDSHIISVGGDLVRAANVLLAVGGCPSLPDFAGRELANISDDLFCLDSLPSRVVVVGGGYIAVEFASILSGLGARVTQVYRGTRLLRNFDISVGEFLAVEMGRHGVEFCFGENIVSLRSDGSGGIIGELSGGGELHADKFFFATGRVANTEGLNLSAAGVVCSGGGFIEVDSDYRTSASHIFAVGDVIGRLALTPVALREASIVIDKLFGVKSLEMDYDLVPTAVFSRPPVAVVGLSEEQATARGISYDIYRSDFTPLFHSLSGSGERFLVKLLTRRGSDEILGIHLVGDSSPEIMQGFAVALAAGAGKRDFDKTIGIHPTSAEELVTLRKA